MTHSAADRFRQIAAEDYAIPADLDATAFMLASIPLLGDTNGEFRERVVYGTLHRWSVSGAVSLSGLRIFHRALLADDALFAGIGERGTDSLFLRAFCVLTLAPTLFAHRQSPYLSVEDLEYTAQRLAAYLEAEVDRRGYVSSEKWWGHAVAHAADALGQLGRCEELLPAALTRLLAASAVAMTPADAVYCHEEDARMATAVLHILRREILPEDVIEAWFARLVPTARFEGTLPDVHVRYVNARNFLRCLYFQGMQDEVPPSLIERIRAAHDALPAR